MVSVYPPSYTVTGVDPLTTQQPTLLMTLSSPHTDTESPYNMTVTDGRNVTGEIWVPIIRDICIAYSIFHVDSDSLSTGISVELHIMYKTGAEGDETTKIYTPTISQENVMVGDGVIAPIYFFQTPLLLRKGDLIFCEIHTNTNPQTFKEIAIYGNILTSPSNLSEGPLQMHTMATHNTVSTTRCLFDTGTQHILIPRRLIGIETVGAVIGVGNTGFSADWSIALTFQAYTEADDHTLTTAGSSKEVTFSGSGREASDPDIMEIKPLNYTIDATSETHFLRVSYVKTGITAASNHLMFSFMYSTQNMGSVEIAKENIALNEYPHTILGNSIGIKASDISGVMRTSVKATLPPSIYQTPRLFLFHNDAETQGVTQFNNVFSRFYGSTATRDILAYTIRPVTVEDPGEGELGVQTIELYKRIAIPTPGTFQFATMSTTLKPFIDVLLEVRNSYITQPI